MRGLRGLLLAMGMLALLAGTACGKYGPPRRIASPEPPAGAPEPHHGGPQSPAAGVPEDPAEAGSAGETSREARP